MAGITLSETFSLIRTDLGRRRLVVRVLQKMWPLSRWLGYFYRSTVLRKTCLIAVVGSYGKTTTVRAVTAALGRGHFPRPGNSKAFVAHALMRVRPALRQAALEVGIDGRGQMKRHARMIRPDVVVVTSIGSEHHRTFGTLEETRHEKAEMLRVLLSRAYAVLNYDDPNVRWMAGETRAQVVTFGTADDCDVYATGIELRWPEGMFLRLHSGGKSWDLQTRLLGHHQIYPVLAAFAAAFVAGHTPEQILERLAGFGSAEGRLQPVVLENGAVVIRDEYKSSLETIDSALEVFAQIPARRKIVVMGEVSEPPGSQGPIYRRIGQRIAETADLAIFLGGNFQRYGAGARSGGMTSKVLVNARNDVLNVIEYLRSNLKRGDVVLVKGRDTQRLDRIGLALAGEEVGCRLVRCGAVARCSSCPDLVG